MGIVAFLVCATEEGGSCHPPQQIQRLNEFNYLGKRSLSLTFSCLYTKRASE
jgi:hypothetical protein